MCATCGCGQDEVQVTSMSGAASPGDGTGLLRHDDTHLRRHDHAHPHTIDIEQAVLARNDHLAAHNRAWLREHGLRTVNLMSSPGAGKTSLLERTIREHPSGIAVIEGDQETVLDAERIRDAGATAVQVNTGSGCHLDATMVERALGQLRPVPGSLVFVENVGNLVCPALFDLGEDRRVVLISVTEGDDKPLKYPHMFASAHLVVINKTDLMPYVDFDIGRCAADARRLNPQVEIVPLSVRTGENLGAWYSWLGAI
jgi:hydrogenase nickel incorporation protein HypB